MCISLRAAFTLRFTFTLRLTDAEPAERTAELLFAAVFTFAELLRLTFALRLADAEPAERTAELLFAAGALRISALPERPAAEFVRPALDALLRLTFALRLADADELPALAEVLRLTDAAPRELFAAERETLPALLRTVSVAWFEEFETLLCPHASLPRVANITKMLRTNANLTVLFMILVLLELLVIRTSYVFSNRCAKNKECV